MFGWRSLAQPALVLVAVFFHLYRGPPPPLLLLSSCDSVFVPCVSFLVLRISFFPGYLNTLLALPFVDQSYAEAHTSFYAPSPFSSVGDLLGAWLPAETHPSRAHQSHLQPVHWVRPAPACTKKPNATDLTYISTVAQPLSSKMLILRLYSSCALTHSRPHSPRTRSTPMS